VNFDDRVQAVTEFGFTERQACFLVSVMLYAGVCVPRQYATFAGTAYGHTVSRFFDKLVRRGYATVCGCLHNRAELYHVRHPALYRAIDQPHSRYRRPVPGRHADRLVFREQPQPPSGALADDHMRQPFAGERRRHQTDERDLLLLRCEPDEFGVDHDGVEPHQPVDDVARAGRVEFTYLVSAYDTGALRAFVQRHADLLRALPGWTLRLVLPPQLADSMKRFEGVVRDELTPLEPRMLAELKWYFVRRHSTPNPRALSSGCASWARTPDRTPSQGRARGGDDASLGRWMSGGTSA
jgi:hypothetical protein